MKFGKTFETHLTIEWRQQYMRYTDLKTLIRRGVDGAPTESETTGDQLLEYYASFEEHFFAECQHELTRVNNFFLEKMAEARRKHGTLKLQLLATAHATGHVSRSHTRSQNQSRSHSQLPSPRASVVSMPSTSSNRKLMTQRQLRSAYTEFYLTLVLLQNFQSLNETGFRKICKKYDKYLKSNHGALWLERHLTYIAFVDRRPLQQMTIEVEELYTHYLAAGDRAKAMTKLRVPPLGEPTPPPMVFRAGLALGMFIMLALAALFSYLRRPPITDNIEAFMRLYRGPFTWVIFNFFMAANVAGWQRAGVNHVLIFEIDPRSHLQPATFLEIACTFGMLWTLSMLGFLFHDLINVTDPFVFPLALTLIMITLLINPLPIMNWPARWWAMRLVGRVITAPLHYVGFADFWMGDQMNSLVTCMADYYYIVRFYAVCWLRYSNVNSCFDEDMFVPISRCLPAWFRFAQCLRRFSDSGSKSLSYLLNAGKYSTTFFVVFFSTMRGRTDVSCRWLCEYVLQSLHVVLHHQLHRVERVQLSVGCVQGLWHLSDLAGRAFVPPGEARLSAILLLLCHPRESRAASLLGHRVRCALPQADHALQYQDLRQHPGDNASLHLELHSPGERASEQLRTLSGHARHSPGCPQSDAGTHAGAYDDGPRAEAR